MECSVARYSFSVAEGGGLRIDFVAVGGAVGVMRGG